MTIRTLECCDETCLDQLVVIDRAMVEKYGKSFSEEVWTKSNFLYHLPEKQTMSLVAFDGSEKPLGYCIASMKHQRVPYIHRFVALKNEHIPVSNVLMDAVLKQFPTISLLVSTINKPAIAFYLKYGFSIVTDEKEHQTLFPECLPLLSSGTIKEDYKFLMRRYAQ